LLGVEIGYFRKSIHQPMTNCRFKFIQTSPLTILEAKAV
jgi:hypothetical protein